MEEIFHLWTKENQFKEGNLKKIIEFLIEFYEKDENRKFYPEKEEKKAKDFIINFLKSSLTSLKYDISIIDWKFQKGACVLKVVDEYDSSNIKLEIICSDEWKMNFTPNNRTRLVSSSMGFSTYFIGNVDTKDEELLLKVVEHILISETKKNSKDSRNLVDFEGRPQNTPGWLISVYESALKQLEKVKDTIEEGKLITDAKIDANVVPKGGFTDVGKHTGSDHRSTVYPLIKYSLYRAFQYLHRFADPIEDLNQVFNYNILLFETYLLELHYKSHHVNDVKQMIHSISLKSKELESFDRELIEEVFKRVSKIGKIDLEMKDLYLQNYSIEGETCPSISAEFPNYSYQAPDPYLLLQRAEWNISGKEVDKNSKISEIISSSSVPLKDKIIHFETYIFTKMKSIKHDEKTFIEKDDVKDLVDSLDKYRSLIDELVKEKGFIITKLKSHRLLITWGVYCLIHQYNKTHIPLLEDYSIPLRREDLSNLVLSDKLALDAFEGISKYIYYYNNKNPKIFSKRDNEINGSFDFILKYFDTNQILVDTLKYEKERSDQKNIDRYEQVKQKRINYSNYEATKGKLEKERDELKRKQELDYEYYRGRQINNLDYEINNYNRYMNNERRFTDVLYHPVSTNEKESKYQVFFTRTPSELMYLFHLGFLSYIDFHKQIPSDPPRTDQNYNEYYTSKSSKSSQNLYFNLFMDKPPNENNIGYKDIFLISESNGVWYPNTSISTFYWKYSSKYLNPFQIDSKECIHLFTETIKNEKFAKLQDMIKIDNLDNTKGSRGNYWIGNQNLKPNHWKKNEFASFCQLRDYPLQQLEKLLYDFKDRNLKLTDENFHLLIKQTLYHLGPFEKDGYQLSSLKWKSSLFNKEYMNELSKVLMMYADEIKETPQNYLILIILGEISGYLSQFDPERFLKIRREFSAIAEKWAYDLDQQIMDYESLGDYKSRAEIMKKQHLFLGYSLLIMEMGDFNDKDYSKSVELILKYHKTKPLLGEKEDTILENLMEYFIANKYNSIVENIKDSYLTNSVTKLMKNLKQDDFGDWKKGKGFYYNQMKDGSYIHINLKNGTILLNGNPPNFLPNDIIDHPLYQSVFGKRNCSVIDDGKGRLKTIYPIHDRNYTFVKDKSMLLVIEELEKDEYNSPTNYHLLNHLDIKKWGDELPERLKNMHSFWITKHEDQEITLLRPISFKDRSTHFMIIKYMESLSIVYRIPKEKLSFEVGRLIEISNDLDQLLYQKHFEKLTNVFEKFESRSFIHYYKTKDKTIKIELPRYDLQFEYDGKIFKSLNFNGYQLQKNQVLEGTLYNFSQYLIIELMNPDSTISINNPTTQVIVPKGQIERIGEKVSISVSDKYNEDLKYSIFKIHQRFNTLKANTIEERLQLATIYAASSSFNLDPMIGKTGSEMAIELLRRCWKNSPFTKEELFYLKNLSKFDHFQPTVSILCKGTYDDSIRLSFLYEKDIEKEDFDTNCSVSEYRVKDHIIPRNLRSELTEEEEKRIYGEYLTRETFSNEIKVKEEDEIFDENIDKYSKVLKDLLLDKKINQDNLEFPFERKGIFEKSIGKKLINELEESWNIAKSLPKMQLSNIKEAKESIEKHKIDITLLRNAFEGIINKSMDESTIGVKFLKLSNNIPIATNEDLLRFIMNPLLMKKFNPDLTHQKMMHIHKTILLWAQLCVLEDKYERISLYLKENNSERAIQEMMVERKWKVEDHPHWLVFEVENRIQIRNEQYELIEQILKEPNTISQLNMGLGKTSVVIPCLFLELSNKSYSKNGDIVRIFLLSQIYEEQFSNLHLTLSASILNRKLFKIPFNRDVKLNLRNVKKIKESLVYCQHIGGCVIICPEYFNSLKLKIEDIYFKKRTKSIEENKSDEQMIKILKEIVELPYYDIFDESDEILHYRKQLIYSIGTQQNLSSGKYRWETIEDVLLIIRHHEKIKEILKNVSTRKDVKSHENDELFLLPLKELEQIKPILTETILQILLETPPESLNWMKKIENKEKIKTFIMDQTIKGSELSEEDFQDNKYYDEILILRGLIGKGILYHCLEKKYNVEYGLLLKKDDKNIAVPYLGADTPSERSEFSHPDCSIIFTILSWYNYGLNRTQLSKTIAHLLNCGISTQESIYKSWFEMIKHGDSNELKSIDSIRKIDLGNFIQLSLLEKYYCKNMKTINYYLNYLVFPQETKVFPKRLISSPWDLTSSKNKCGFSGTNDTSILLPLTVHQREPFSDFLKATSGHILRLVLEKSEYKQFKSTNVNDLIQFIIDEKIDALIDVGAVLAGFDNERFANELLKKLDGQFKGVVYFNIQDNDWKFKNKDGIIWRLVNSPIKEREAFVFFDQRRCRGSDMKLKTNAKGLVTISSKLKKDDFMQACGRMRGLEYGQTLILAGDENVSKLILESVNQSSNIQVKYVMEFVLINVIKTIKNGFTIFAGNGRHYYKKLEDEDNYIKPELSSLKDLYLNSNKEKFISETIQSDSNNERILEIEDHLKKYGSDEKIIESSQDEECEREKEKEVEKEIQSQKEYEDCEITSESDTFTYKKLEEIFKYTDIFNEIQWSENLYISENFLKPVKTDYGNYQDYNFKNYLQTLKMLIFKTNDYLQVIKYVLYNDKIIILITDREAEKIKEVERDDFKLIHFSELKSRKDDKLFKEITQFKVFSGETSYNEKEKEVIKEMLKSKKSVENIRNIVIYRGNSHLYDSSELEKVCIDFEENQIMKKE